jgi:hypothetical protein
MIKWNEVTWYSKLLSLVFFLVVLPIIFVIIAKRYKEVVSTYSDTKTTLESSVEKIKETVESASTTKTATTTP